MLFQFFVCLHNLFYFQAPQLNPFPTPCSVVVVDNCTIHHDEEIRCIIDDECGKLQPCNSVLQTNSHLSKVPDLFIFHLTLLTTTRLNKPFIPSRHGFIAMRLMLSMPKSDPGLYNRQYSLSHQKWQKDGLKTVGTHSWNSITCNCGQRNTIYTREHQRGVVVRISIVSNPAPLFLLLLQVSIPSTAKNMKFEGLAFRHVSDIT